MTIERALGRHRESHVGARPELAGERFDREAGLSRQQMLEQFSIGRKILKDAGVPRMLQDLARLERLSTRYMRAMEIDFSINDIDLYERSFVEKETIFYFDKDRKAKSGLTWKDIEGEYMPKSHDFRRLVVVSAEVGGIGVQGESFEFIPGSGVWTTKKKALVEDAIVKAYHDPRLLQLDWQQGRWV